MRWPAVPSARAAASPMSLAPACRRSFPGQEDPTQRAACWLVAEPAALRATPAAPAEQIAAPAAESAAPLLQLRGLEMRFPAEVNWLGRPQAHVHALNGVNLEIRPGEVLGLVGESGSGKTTIGRAIAGLTPVSDGSLNVLGVEMLGVKERTFPPSDDASGSCSRTPRRASTRC